jgi:hypothetical protein
VTRQTGFSIQVTTERDGQHHEVIQNHAPIKVGTLSSILWNIAAHHGMSGTDLLRILGLGD